MRCVLASISVRLANSARGLVGRKLVGVQARPWQISWRSMPASSISCTRLAKLVES